MQGQKYPCAWLFWFFKYYRLKKVNEQDISIYTETQN